MEQSRPKFALPQNTQTVTSRGRGLKLQFLTEADHCYGKRRKKISYLWGGVCKLSTIGRPPLLHARRNPSHPYPQHNLSETCPRGRVATWKAPLGKRCSIKLGQRLPLGLKETGTLPVLAAQCHSWLTRKVTQVF